MRISTINRLRKPPAVKGAFGPRPTNKGRAGPNDCLENTAHHTPLYRPTSSRAGAVPNTSARPQQAAHSG